jgi:hypothetical protein
MDTGMLWFDDGPQGLSDKVARAVSFYATKYGRTPTVCLVHPVTIGGAEVGPVSGVVVRETHAILPNHFLVGIEELPARAADPKRGRKARPDGTLERSPERSRGATAARRKAA